MRDVGVVADIHAMRNTKRVDAKVGYVRECKGLELKLLPTMTTFDDETEQYEMADDLWPIIANSKATQIASLKRLQHFVLSLGLHELRHLVSVYLRSEIAKRHNRGELTLRSTVESMINNREKVTAIGTCTDRSILCKLRSGYGTKCGKKVLSMMQQARSTILCVPPQVLSTAFQFLAFKDQCCARPTCSMFMYLHARYRGLCRYHIELDHKLRMCLHFAKNCGILARTASG